MRGGARDETREKFLATIADKLPAEKVIEVHLFQPIKQAGTESRVAVVAVEEERPPTAEGSAEDRPAASGAAENSRQARSASAESNRANRLAVYTAKYRLTQKGPDRGKWEFAVQVEADAPLLTVDKVVRGVQRRSGDAEDPERLSGDEFRALLPPRESTQGQSA
jgi:hypothetical protein